MSERVVSVWPGDRGFLQVAQLLLQALGEELLVEAGGAGPGRAWIGYPKQGITPVVAGWELAGKGTSRLMVA
jgi:hypothetical protein